MVTTKNFRNDEEPDFSDPEDFDDDITDEELLPELMALEPRLDESIDRIIVVDNIPKVGQEKREKLRQILLKLLQNYGTILNEHYPDDDGVLKGYMFVEYNNEQSAKDAQSMLNGYALDKNHIFKVNFLSDFDAYEKLNLNEEVTPAAPYKDPGNLMWWLTIPKGYDQYDQYDQFAVLFGDMSISVFLNTQTQLILLENRKNWTATRFQWSPKGTYMATFHDKGLALWAGEQFKQFVRFLHPGVQLIDFSPCERYAVTCNPNYAGVNDQAIMIWCVRTGQLRRSFSCERAANMPWPFFKWSHDDKYFARCATDALLVYETETFALLNKKSIKIQKISDFEWSTVDNYISYWVAEDKNVLARVVLMEIPSKTEIRSKNLVNVADCKMYWQSHGDFVCVRVDRYKKINMVKEDDKEVVRYGGIYHNFEIFRIREKQIPVDSIEIKETCQGFAWEPFGQKFCIAYGESQAKVNAAFYRILNATGMSAGKLELIKEVKSRVNVQISWSPQGQHCVLASKSAPFVAEFYEISNDVQLLNKVEFENFTDLEWDPTGRFVVFYVSYWNSKAENSYNIYSFQGKWLNKANFDKLFKFSWRPRPASLLQEEQKKEIRAKLKTYSDKYIALDKRNISRISKELLEKRRDLISEFNLLRKISERRLFQQRRQRLELRNGFDADIVDDSEEVEYTVQFLVDSKKEEVAE